MPLRPNELFETHLAWALRKAAAFARGRRLPDYLHPQIDNAARRGLLRAAERYDESRARFKTYATQIVQHEMQDELRENDSVGKRAEFIRTHGAVPARLHIGALSKLGREKLFAKAATRDPDALELHDQVEHVLRRAGNARWRAVIVLHDQCGWPMKEIGAALGVSESRVWQFRIAALKRMRGEASR